MNLTVHRFAFLALGVSACSGSVNVPPGAPAQADIDAYVRGIELLPEHEPKLEEGQPSEAIREGDYSCSSTDYKETRQYDKIVAFAANSESLWPGALIAGNAVYDGLFTPIALPRAPMRFSVSLENLDGAKSAVMDAPSLSSFRDELTGILAAKITGATPANIFADIDEVHSEDQLALALGVKVDLVVAGFGTSFDFSKSNVHSRYLVKYTQAYYTVDVDAPPSPSTIFDPSVKLSDVEARVPATSPPLYVSSITYGRTVLFAFESEYSSNEVGAALDFVYHGGVDVSGDVSVTYKEILSKTKITAYILGGSGSQAAQSIDSYEALLDFIHSGGDYTRESPGAPIAYKLSYLANNAPARLSFTDDYTVKTCDRVSQRVLVKLKSIQVEDAHGDPSSDLEIFGKVEASGADAQASATGTQNLFDHNEDNYVAIGQGTIYPISGDEISESILTVSPQAGATIQLHADLWDSDGILPDTHVGDETVSIPFELGWRKPVVVRLSGDGTKVNVTLELQPI
jgi:thiol-activated cytolysin